LPDDGPSLDIRYPRNGRERTCRPRRRVGIVGPEACNVTTSQKSNESLPHTQTCQPAIVLKESALLGRLGMGENRMRTVNDRIEGHSGRRSQSAKISRLAVVVCLVLILFPTISNDAAQAACSGKKILPSDHIAAIVNNSPSDTSFCIAPGTYRPSVTIRPKDGDRLSGTGLRRDDVLITTGKLEVLIDAGFAQRVVYNNFAVSGAVNACPGRNCGPTGDGIRGGSNVTATNVHVYANGRTGFSNVTGLSITGSRLDHNGAVRLGTDGVSGGVKSAAPLSVINSVVDHNYGDGIWCDRGCGAFTAKGNRVLNNYITGIHDEVSQGPAVIANNVVQNNNLANQWGHSGIGIVDSKNVDVYGNTLGGNLGAGISARHDQRTTGFLLDSISIHGNTMKGDVLIGCSASGVTCYSNTFANRRVQH
jgi:hypothetical protein